MWVLPCLYLSSIQSSFSIQICRSHSGLHLQASVQSTKWHYLSTLFSVFLVSNSHLNNAFFPEICPCLARCVRNISTFCFLHLLVNSCWHLPVPTPRCVSNTIKKLNPKTYPNLLSDNIRQAVFLRALFSTATMFWPLTTFSHLPGEN